MYTYVYMGRPTLCVLQCCLGKPALTSPVLRSLEALK